MPKLTKTIVEKTHPGNRDIILRDTEVVGFQCKITPSGKRVYMLYYRASDGKERRPAIGQHGAITCDQARDIAKQWLAEVIKGGDPSKSRKELRSSVTVKELWEIYEKAREPYLKPSSATELRVRKKYG